MKDVEFMTGKEKELALKAWTTFVKHGFQRKHFTKRIYSHLSLHCSFIAHYNIHGFYDTYFTSPENTLHFMTQFDRRSGAVSVEYGSTHWLNDPDYTDLNNAFCGIIEQYQKGCNEQCQSAIRKRDIKTAHALLLKHGKEV